jgi:gas vesicle protein
LRVASGRGSSPFSARHKAQSAYFTGLEPIWEIAIGLKFANARCAVQQAARMMFNESKLPVRTVQRGAFMREGKYESSEISTVGTAITFLLIGLGAGAVIGLLFAPKAGKQMRKELRRKYDDARETLDDWKDDAKDLAEDALERGQEIADDLRGRVAPLAAAMKRR